MEQGSKILIVGANGAMGGFVLLKLYGNKNLSTLILPSERETFTKDKLMQEDQWFPKDTTFIKKEAFVFGKEPVSDKEVGLFTMETIPKSLANDVGIVVIASKIFHYDSVLDTIKPILNKNTILFNLVNGLKPEITLEKKCRERGIFNTVIRAVVMGGTHFTMNRVADCLEVHSGVAKFIIGNWDKTYSPEYRDQLDFIVRLFPKERFEIVPQYGDDYRMLSLDKVLANLVNPISAFTGCPTIEYVNHPLLKKIITECFNQGINVGLKLGLNMVDRADIIKRKLEMYEKAGLSAKAHLPSMGQDSLRAILNQTRLLHENEHIGVAIVKEGLEATDEYNAQLVASFNRLLNQVTDHYNHLFVQKKDKAAKFLLHLMMKNRYSLGLNPHNIALYDQFEGLEKMEADIEPDYSKIDKIKTLQDAPEFFEKNLITVIS